MLTFCVTLLTQIINTSLWHSVFQRGFCFYSLRHTSDMKATLPIYTQPLIIVQNCVMSGLKVKKLTQPNKNCCEDYEHAPCLAHADSQVAWGCKSKAQTMHPWNSKQFNHAWPRATWKSSRNWREKTSEKLVVCLYGYNETKTKQQKGGRGGGGGGGGEVVYFIVFNLKS